MVKAVGNQRQGIAGDIFDRCCPCAPSHKRTECPWTSRSWTDCKTPAIACLIWFREFCTWCAYVHTKCTPVLAPPSLLPPLRETALFTEKWNNLFSIHFWGTKPGNFSFKYWEDFVKLELTRLYESLLEQVDPTFKKNPGSWTGAVCEPHFIYATERKDSCKLNLYRWRSSALGK